MPIVGRTTAEADEKYEYLQSLIHPQLGLSLLSDMAGGVDLGFKNKAGIDLKGPMLTHDEAAALLDECMKVLFYRDARSLNKVSSLL